MPSSLSSATLYSMLSGKYPSLAVEVVERTGSTNADLLARVAHLDAPVLLVAETQTAGRGRAGRSWQSSPGASLTFSLAWKFALPLHALAALPLAVGVAVCDTLHAFGVDAKLKWPNDVLADGAKMAGVLIETASVRDATWAVIGVGINLSLTPELAGRIGTPAAAVGGNFDRHALMAALADTLRDELSRFEAEGFKAFVERWSRVHAHAGQVVRILDQGAVLHEGIAEGVDASGRLQLRTAQGMISVMSGDVSLRPVDESARLPGLLD